MNEEAPRGIFSPPSEGPLLSASGRCIGVSDQSIGKID